jgi:hypothetical protein
VESTTSNAWSFVRYLQSLIGRVRKVKEGTANELILQKNIIPT